MKRFFYVLLIIVFGILVYFRIQAVEAQAQQKSAGIEQTYKEQGFPIETAEVQQGEFLAYCQVNGYTNGIRQTEVMTNVVAKIQDIKHEVGDYVKADEVIISLDKEDPRSSSQYRQLKAVYDTTLKSYNRLKELRANGAIPQSQLDEVKMNLDVARANLESVVKTVSLSSTVSGVILDIRAREGELIQPGRAVAVVAQVDRVRMVASVSQRDVMKLKVGQRVLVGDQDGGVQHEGRVTKVSLNADQRSGLFRVEMEVDNSDHGLKIGTFTAARVEVFNDPQATFIALRALQQDVDGNNYVYVVDGDRVHKRVVAVAGMNDDFVLISSGVEPGEKIVVGGISRLSDNARVTY